MQAAFPHLAGWRRSSLWLEGQSLEPKRSISGTDTIVATMRGRWRAKGVVVIAGEAAHLQWQAFVAQMQGRIGTSLVPAVTRFGAKAKDGLPLPLGQIGGIAAAQTWEHFGFEGAPVTRITLASDAALRATTLDLTLSATTGLRPGQFFSLADRLYRVQHHWQPGNPRRILIEPPLRAAVSAGARVEIDRPVCRMRFVSETEGLLNYDVLDPAPQIQIEFAEAI